MATAHQPGGIYKDATGNGYHDAHGRPIARSQAERIIREQEQARIDAHAFTEVEIEEQQERELAARRLAREALKTGRGRLGSPLPSEAVPPAKVVPPAGSGKTDLAKNAQQRPPAGSTASGAGVKAAAPDKTQAPLAPEKVEGEGQGEGEGVGHDAPNAPKKTEPPGE